MIAGPLPRFFRSMSAGVDASAKRSGGAIDSSTSPEVPPPVRPPFSAAVTAVMSPAVWQATSPVRLTERMNWPAGQAASEGALDAATS